jgi:hypothetical protein
MNDREQNEAKWHFYAPEVPIFSLKPARHPFSTNFE